ncbi:MAG TPA: DUF6249 domain-containing protein [Clostridia bacterium]|nr:DUF6249 domain-containing protein [Clostridia bacterium]
MGPQILALLIPIIAIILGILLAMMVIYLGYRRRKEVFALYHTERMAALEKGVELPPLPDALLSEDGRPFFPYTPRRHLLRGLVWLFAGLGLGAALGPTAGWDVALFALIPIGIGMAHLIYYFVEGRKEAEAMEKGKAEALTRP